MEYLNVLQNLAKWQSLSPDVKVGDTVCVRGEQSPPTKWPLARIQEVIPGDDGLVRVVVIRTSKGVYKRPITTLCRYSMAKIVLHGLVSVCSTAV